MLQKLSSYQIVARGKKGTLQYRKQVPVDVQPKLKKREWTKSLRTTNPYHAELKARRLDLGYEELIQALRCETSPLKNLTMHPLRSANQQSSNEPELSLYSTKAELVTAYKLANDLQEKESIPPQPTFAEITDLYFAEKNDKSIGKTYDQKQHSNQKTRAHLKWIARYLGAGDIDSGWTTTIDEITPKRLLGYREWWLELNPNKRNSSYNKPPQYANAVFNVAIKKLGLQQTSPFSGMKLPEGKSPRLPFTPAQFELVQKNR